MTHSRVSKRGHAVRYSVVVFVALVANRSSVRADVLDVSINAEQQLQYVRDDRGNHIPDFSHCGYAGADRPIPDVPAVTLVSPVDGDDGVRIQAAIDHVSQRPIGADGFRGAVLLGPGTFDVEGQLAIRASGVVLRGAGTGEGGTALTASGLDRRTLLLIGGVDDRKLLRKRARRVQDEYVPVGSNRLNVDAVDDLKVGSTIIITRPSTAEWIRTIGADAFGVNWKPGTRNVQWDRVITGIEGNTLTIDAPITTAIEKRFGGATVEAYDWPGRIENVGVEDLEIRSSYAVDQPHDEDHAWYAVGVQNAHNAWVRCVAFRHFSGGAVTLAENTKWVTVVDCLGLEPVSELAGYRRHTFLTQGQLTLFLRCWSERGRRDFSVGHCAAGPNAFVNCHAHDAQGDSGPIESWASGVLYDNVRIDGAGLNLENRWISPPGAGWSAANCVLWQCQAATMHVSRPPTANNWAIGVWAGLSGDGTFQARSDFVRPVSLYQLQLQERRGARSARHLSLGLVDPIGSTNPTVEEAAAFTAQSNKPARTLLDTIREQCDQRKNANRDRPKPTEVELPASTIWNTATSDTAPLHRIALQNGWLVVDGRLITGGLQQQPFWRGTTRSGEAAAFGPAITRFVPGRVGTGFTDDLGQVASNMQAGHVAVFDHHHGLWYDRRRDDHTMVRQRDGDVAPPFYEQPFLRTGIGQSWNGLSKYDLSKFNPWYWNRLRSFATLCDQRGLALFHEHYFQHNILEAGAHWADSPWRTANNINDTGFPEPPPYIGDKRIFMAEQYYDVANLRRRELHRNYIRKCLSNFAKCSNVVHLTSAEYSGPLEFTQFWIDTAIEWQKDHNQEALIALSAPKDVQDAILADPVRSPHVDIIDIRYWCYTQNGELYAPKGGKNLSPRQHMRQTRQKPGGFSAVVKAVSEYRRRFPDKPVTYYADMNCPSGRDGWAVLMGGGSLPNAKLPEELAAIIPSLAPSDEILIAGEAWCLGGTGGDYVIYVQTIGDNFRLKLPNDSTSYRVYWIDGTTGKQMPAETVVHGDNIELRAKTNVAWLHREPKVTPVN